MVLYVPIQMTMTGLLAQMNIMMCCEYYQFQAMEFSRIICLPLSCWIRNELSMFHCVFFNLPQIHKWNHHYFLHWANTILLQMKKKYEWLSLTPQELYCYCRCWIWCRVFHYCSWPHNHLTLSTKTCSSHFPWHKYCGCVPLTKMQSVFPFYIWHFNINHQLFRPVIHHFIIFPSYNFYFHS